MQKSCVYLGHRLDAEGIHPTNEKLLALQQAPIPTCVTELRSYVGLVHYYHKLLKNVSAVLKPLYELLQADTSWHWGLPQQRAFEASKALIQSSKVLVHYNARLPLVLSCDASAYGIGAVLSHRMSDDSDRPIAFASRTLAPAEKRYAQLDREGLAILFGVTKFHKYVYGRDFEIQSDHMPLLELMSEDKLISPLASARIQHWALTLSNYQYHLRYKQGVQNSNADALSRLPVPTPAKEVPVPAEVVLSLSVVNDTPRVRLDLLLPGRENRVLQQREKAQESHNSAVPEQMFYAGDTVWAMNFAAAAPKWLPGVLQQCLGPVTFTVGLTDGRVWRRHIDHLRARLPEENVTTTSPRPPESTVLPATAIPPAREDIAEAATAKPPPDLSSYDSAIVNDVPSSPASQVVVPELPQIDKIRATDHEIRYIIIGKVSYLSGL